MNMGFRWLGSSYDWFLDMFYECEYNLSFEESPKDGSISIHIYLKPTGFEGRITQRFDIGCPTLLDDIRHTIDLSLKKDIKIV